MRKKRVGSLPLLLLALGSISVVWACSSNSTGDNGNDKGGSNPETYYAEHIQTIFSENCGGPDCHIPGPTSGVRLDNYTDAINSTGDQYGTKIIKAGDAAGSPIIDKISNARPKHGVRMPNGRTPLTQAQIDTLINWIDRGAKENG